MIRLGKVGQIRQCRARNVWDGRPRGGWLGPCSVGLVRVNPTKSDQIRPVGGERGQPQKGSECTEVIMVVELGGDYRCSIRVQCIKANQTESNQSV